MIRRIILVSVLFGFLLGGYTYLPAAPCDVNGTCSVVPGEGETCQSAGGSIIYPTGNYGCSYDNNQTFKGVTALSNGSLVGQPIGNLNYQCATLAQRFYGQFFSIPLNTEKIVSAKNFYLGYESHCLKRFGLDIFVNGGTQKPRMGDMIVFSNGSNGHVAIFCNVTSDGAHIKVFEQNVSNTTPFRDDLPYSEVTSNGITTYTITGSANTPTVGWAHLNVGCYDAGFHLDASGNALDWTSKAFIDTFNNQPKYSVNGRDWKKIGWPTNHRVTGGAKDVYQWLGQANSSFGVVAQDFIQDNLSLPHYGNDGRSILILNDLEGAKEVHQVSGGIFGHYRTNDGPYNYGVPYTDEIQGYYANSHLVLPSDIIQPSPNNMSAPKRITVQKFKRRLANGTYYNEQRRTLVYNPGGPANDPNYNVSHFPVGELSLGTDISNGVPAQLYIQGSTFAHDIPWPMLGILTPTGRWFTKPGAYNFVRHDANGTWLMGSGKLVNVTEGNYQFAGDPSPELSPPRNLSAASVSQNSITIIWDPRLDNTLNFTYNIYRSTNQSFGSASLIASTANNSYSDVGLSSGTIYYYWVKALSGSLLSDYSNLVAVTTQSAGGDGTTPTAPNNLSCAFLSNSQVNVRWSCGANNPNNIADYKLFKGTTNNSATAVYWALTPYTEQVITGLDPSTTYYFWAKAVNHNGVESGFSAMVSVNMANYFFPPENLTATNSNGSIILNWSCQSSNVSFIVYKSSVADFSSQSVIQQATSLNCIDAGGTVGSTYYYRVCSNLNGILSGYSNAVSATFSAFLPPSNFRIVEVISGKVKLAWDRSPGTIYDYWVMRYLNGTRQWLNSTTDTFYVDSTVAPGVTYSYKIKARSNITSAISVELFAVTQPRFIFSGSWVCDSVVDGSLQWSKQAVNIKNSFNQGDKASLLVEYRNVFVNHRHKVDIYYNGAYSWTYGGTDWINVGPTGWGYSYVTPSIANCQPGYYEYRIFLDTGAGFWQTDSKTFNVAPSGPQYLYSGAWTCDSVVNGSEQYSKVPLDQKTEFTQGASIYCLAVLRNVSVNHRIKVDVFKDGYYSWTCGGDWNVVNGTWAYSNAIVQQSNAAPGNYQFKIYLDVGSGYQQVDSKTCHVATSGPGYDYFGSWTCDSTADGIDPNSKAAVNAKTNFLTGQTMYCLAVFKNVRVNHRIKVDIYRNGTLSWTWGNGAWNIVNGVWGYSNAIVANQVISDGQYEFRIFIDVGNGYQQIDSKICQVTAGYTYSGSWTCDSVADGSEQYSKVAVNAKTNFTVGHTMYCLSVFRNVYVNNRVKVDVYYNGAFSWTWGSGAWNIVNGTWSYLNVIVTNSNASAGQYQFKIYIDTGAGYQLFDTKNITVS
jgi:fibronectin type 3 domain-containing protein